MNLKSKRGFTLVELIIVIAILGIIALIAVPSLTGVQKRSQVNADTRTAEQIGKSVRVWLTDGNINQTRDRENYIKGKYVLLSEFTQAKVDASPSTTTNNGLEDYISLDYKPNVTNSAGTALNFYIGLINNKVAVAIDDTTPGATTSTVYEFAVAAGAAAGADPEVIEGVAYVEGISTLLENNVKTALGIS